MSAARANRRTKIGMPFAAMPGMCQSYFRAVRQGYCACACLPMPLRQSILHCRMATSSDLTLLST
eukprot:11768951-Karenia_brevis.AAC.1